MKSTCDSRAVFSEAWDTAPADRRAATVVVAVRVALVVAAAAVAVALTLG